MARSVSHTAIYCYWIATLTMFARNAPLRHDDKGQQLAIFKPVNAHQQQT
jgi:hypothetical protein